jgi:hypothetical protein
MGAVVVFAIGFICGIAVGIAVAVIAIGGLIFLSDDDTERQR